MGTSGRSRKSLQDYRGNDSLDVAAGISRAAKQAGVEIGIRAEFDTGFHRCGWPITAPSMDEILKIIALPSLRWDGILVYPGHIMGNETIREQDIERENATMDALFELLDSASIPYPVVSGGNTPAAFASHRFHGLTEIRPGTYVFNDRNTMDAESAEFGDCALTVLVTVVSRSAKTRAIVDAGSKTLSADSLLSGDRQGYGYVVGHPELKLEDLSEEHGHMCVPCDSRIKIGDRLRIIPNHVCTCINLHDCVFVVDGEQVIDQWKVAARGRVA
jgi:D-serine deaminase-like pyridoxal phosphate-dependent protein